MDSVDYSMSMPFAIILVYSIVTVVAIALSMATNRWARKIRGLPPGPTPLPLVGNMLHLGNKPHESLFHLASKYGPLISLSLGSKTMVVVSSADMAKEFLKHNDSVFAGRDSMESSKPFGYYKRSLIFSQPDAHWRFLRRISANELFSAKKLNQLLSLRTNHIHHMVLDIFEAASQEQYVDLGDAMLNCSTSLLGIVVFGHSMFDPQSSEFLEFKNNVNKTVESAVRPNVADYFPFLNRFDPQGIYRETKHHMGKVLDTFERFINDRLDKRSKGASSDGDLLDVLLDLRSDEFSISDIKTYLIDIFSAGTNTTLSSVVWVMAQLLNNPTCLKKVQEETDGVVGSDRLVEEKDTGNMPYLQAVVKEAFRMHPPVPFLVPHKARENCKIGGYNLPKDAQIIVNTWAIGRDTSTWEDALVFKPERFMNSAADFRGHHFELIPFGAGRRICVGMPLADKIIHSTLASLIHAFDWSPPHNTRVDLEDKFGVALHKATPLLAVPTPRLPTDVYQ